MDIKIRRAEISDARAMLDIYGPYVTKTAITFEYDVPSLKEFTRRIEETVKKYPWIVAESKGKTVGYAYAGMFHAREAYDRAVETSIYVAEDCRKSGVGRALHDALESILKKQGILNMNACISMPVAPDEYLDTNSVDFHAHLGYRLVGEFYKCGYKFGRWYNMVWMEKLIGEHSDDPQRVKTFSEVDF